MFYKLVLQKDVAIEDFIECFQTTSQTGVVKLCQQFRKYIHFDLVKPSAWFVGRNDELKVLESEMALNVENHNIVTVISQMSSVIGIGGIGKTELLREFLSHPNFKQVNIAWLNADNEASIGDSFRRLAPKVEVNLSSEGRERDIHDIVQDIFRRFEKARTIFVYDNCDNPEILHDHRYLPKVSTLPNPPKIFITSRNNRWQNVKTILLDKLKPEDAMELVKSQLNQHDLHNSYTENSCQALIEMLELFPLAIQQSVAYIMQQNLKMPPQLYTIDMYIEDFREKSKTLLDSDAFQNTSCDYTKTTYTTWRVTLDKLVTGRVIFPEDVEIINLFGYLDPDSIQLSILDSCVSTKRLEAVMSTFEAYSVLSCDPASDRYRIHRLFQEVIRQELISNSKEEQIIQKVLELVNKNEKSRATLHATAVWRHACKYESIIGKFYSKSIYTVKRLSPLHLMSVDGNKDAVRRIVEFKGFTSAMCNSQDEFGRTAVYIAAALGHCVVLDTLLSFGACVSTRCNICFTSLEQLNINTLEPSGWTALHAAVYFDRLEAIKLLLSHDETLVNAQDTREHTPPIIAVCLGRREALRIMKPNDPLLEVCALIASVSKNESLYEELEEKVLKLENKERVLNTFLLNHSRLEWMDYNVARIAAHVGAPVRVVKLLETNGVNLLNDFQLLMLSGCRNNVEFANHILTQLGNPDLQVKDGRWTLLHNAAKYGALDMLKLLIENFTVNIDVKTKEGDTPLHQAAFHGHLPIVKYLVEVGANVNSVSNLGCIPLTCAAATYRLDIVKYLLKTEDCRLAPCEIPEGENTLLGMLRVGLPHLLVAHCEIELLDYVLADRNIWEEMMGFNFVNRNTNELNATLLHAAAFFDNTKATEYIIAKIHPSRFNESLDFLQILKALYRAAENNAFEIPHKNLIKWSISAAYWFPKETFSVTPAQFAYIWGSESFDLLKQKCNFVKPSILLRVISWAVPQLKDMVRFVREYLNVHKSPEIEAGKDVTKLTMMFGVADTEHFENFEV